MLFHELRISHPNQQLLDVSSMCSGFVSESCGLPLYKMLPTTYADIQKVKVRQQRKADVVDHVFNEAFSAEFKNLRQRAIISHSSPPTTVHENMELFYVLPPNGFKFLYSKEVVNSSFEYKKVIDTIFEHVDSIDAAADIVTDMLKYTYTNDALHEGISAHAEIIIYNVPYYFAVRAGTYPDYSKLISP